MNLICRYIMSFTFCLCKNSKDSQCSLFCILCHITVLYHMCDFFQPPMLMMMMSMCRFCVMSMCVFLCMRMHMHLICTILMCMEMGVCLCIFMMSVKIFHIMIMVFMFFIQHDIKITGINTTFYDPADFCLKT